MQKLIWSLVFLVSPLIAAEPICVRNYGEQICSQFPDSYTQVLAAEGDEDAFICARIYSAFYCAGAKKEYNLVTAVSGEKICVLNTNQPPVSNLCQTVPQFYNYIRSK